ncbi:MAG: putative DNA binding domain-containing protein [Candidatus Magnetomorum sp.]|nr:putative DNA binding domain-containing protein [Candidatus Magnetomorum sp.]
MNSFNIEAIFKQEGNEGLSFIERIEDPHQLCEEMVAIANANGGLLIIGVNQSGESMKLSDDDIVSAMRMITQVSFEYVHPSIFPKTQLVDYQEAKAIVIQIPAGIQKPYCTVTGRFLIKTESKTIEEIEIDDLRHFFQEKMITQADQMIVEGADHRHIDIENFQQFFEKKFTVGLPGHIPLMTILESMKLASNGQINTAGMLLFGSFPNENFSLSQIVAMSFYGNDTSVLEYRDSDNFEGTIAQLFDQGMNFIQQNLAAPMKENPSLKEIPEKVIQEVLINALVHRSYYMDYFTSGNIVISVFDNRIEIESPGALPEILTLDSIKTGTAFQRNSTIAHYLTDMLPFRGIGLGISAILSKYPGIELIDDEDSDQFIVVIKRPE